MVTLDEWGHSDMWDYDRDRLHDLVALLRAVGCVLSGAALLVREVRRFVRVQRPRRVSPVNKGRLNDSGDAESGTLESCRSLT